MVGMVKLLMIAIKQAYGCMQMKQRVREHFQKITVDLNGRTSLSFHFWCQHRGSFTPLLNFDTHAIMMLSEDNGMGPEPLWHSLIVCIWFICTPFFRLRQSSVVLNWINPCLLCQSSPATERSHCRLTIYNQPWNLLSIAYGTIVQFDLDYVQRVCPVEFVLFWGTAILMGDDQVGGEVRLIDYPTQNHLWVINGVALGGNCSNASVEQVVYSILPHGLL